MHFCQGNQQSPDYYVDVSPPPSQVTSSSIITITCYQDESLRVAIPSNVVWTKINQGWYKKLQNRGHSYICTPNDIGSSIEVEVTSNHNQFGERNSFKINFQTIKLDPLLRPIIEDVIKNSVVSFAVNIISGNKTKEYLLHISDIDIQIKDPRTGSNIKSSYSAIQPQFIENTNDSCLITQIIPKQNEQDYLKFFGKLLTSDKSMSIKIRFDERSSRDTFILARKAFVVKRQMRLFNIIQNSLESSISNPNSVDLLIEMSSIKSFNEYLLKKKQMYKNQVEILQEQIINLKNTYQGILKQKIEKAPQKSKFDAVLSLLDSSIISKKLGLGLNNSDLIHGFDFSQKMKLQVIGQQNNILESGIRINTSENVIYSQVFPFNQSRYSKKRSYDQPIRNNQIIEHNSRSQKSNTDPESILNSSNQVNSNLDNSLNPRFQKDADKLSKMQLYSAWQEEAHKNFMLQSKIIQLQNVITKSKGIENPTPQGQTYFVKQKKSLNKQISQKQELVNLLNAENANLKLQIDNSNALKQAYRTRCSQMQKSIQNTSSLSFESLQRFQSRLNPYMKQSQKLLKQSVHLNELLKSAISQQIHK